MADQPEPLKIPAEILDQIYREARKSYPAECCGWLSGAKGGNGVSTVRPCENAQETGAHPSKPERTAESAYVFTGQDLMELNRSLDGEQPARVIYHSHPNGMAYLSETDRQVATSPWGDGPAYPVQQLVVGIDGERVVESALFDWSHEAGEFVEAGRFPGAAI